MDRKMTSNAYISEYNSCGFSYFVALKTFHDLLKPATYFEIGTLQGHTLSLSNARTIAVDPFFQLEASGVATREVSLFFQMKSDDFFKKYNPAALLGAKLELSFLDGLHYFEFLLRDFINTEKYCNRNSIIALHDCIPMNPGMTGRHNVGLWTGDVWKVLPILKQFRPDLSIYVFDAAPTGLVCCTNLDPSSSVLSEHYHEIVDKWRDIKIEDYGFERFLNDAGLISTDQISDYEGLTRYFWL
jgi:hypothetical protein